MDATTHPQPVQTTPPRRTFRGRPFLITLAVLTLLGAAWWYSQPKSYHYIAHSSPVEVTLIPCQDGYLTQEKAGWVLRDWVTGKDHWRVVPAPDHPKMARMAAVTSPIPNVGMRGDICAAISAQPTGARLQVWRNGAITFDKHISGWTGRIFYIRVLNDGRVIAWQQRAPRCPAVVVQDGKIVARGTLPFHKDGRTFVAPDGQFAAVNKSGVGVVYAPITIANGILTAKETLIKSVYIGADRYPPYYEEGELLVAGQTLIADDFLGPKGRIASDGWSTDTITPGGVYLLQSKGPRSRVYAPSTGKNWSYRVGDGNRGGDATMDGRCALAYFTPSFPPQAIRLIELLRQIPGVGRAFPDPSGTTYIALYERPGKLRAQLRINQEAWWPEHGFDATSWWFPSPDGRAFVVNMESGSGCRCVLFRW
jgi:hypothetical protein